MKKLGLTFVAGVFTLMITSCNKFLDVVPEDKFLISQVYSNEISVNNTLNGIYLNIAKPNLYGENLTMGVTDIFGQYYSTKLPFEFVPPSDWQFFMKYDQNNQGVMGKLNAIWSNGYTAILNLNSFISNVHLAEEVVAKDKLDILKGEAYGLRAMLHFDLLRMFGPVYSMNPKDASIPYLKEANEKIQKILPADEVLNNVLNDLDSAELLLAKDPIVTSGVDTVFNSNPAEDFYKLRNRRMNYYSVLILKSRANLYAGNKTEALNYSLKVINEAKRWFPWVDSRLTSPSVNNPDRVFSTEVVFGLQNYEMNNSYRNLFTTQASLSGMLMQRNEDVLRSLFDYNENDFRYRLNFILVPTDNGGLRIFRKFEDISNKSLFRRSFQPLIRISECYLIAAKCVEDKNQAIQFINNIRRNRGLNDLADNANINLEINKEYLKDMWGEGQLFFYNKRRALTSVISGSGSNISMTLSDYVMRLPNSELENR